MTKITEERCARCGGTLGASASGSITQWIAVCNCASRRVETDNAGSADSSGTGADLIIRMCAKCGKRLNEGRAGSLTQWVFRQDLCACEEPEPFEALSSSVSRRGETEETSSRGIFSGVTAQNDGEAALDVAPEKFPLDRYAPLAEIGKGGSGTVYYCRDRILDRIVAVKTLHALNAQQLLSFQNEARASSRLSHPSIVKVLDFGATASGAPYMAMDFIDGVSLLKLIESGTMFSVDEVIELFCAVCDGLSHAHEAGILHRDIKCSNLLISENNHGELDVTIIDFGVAVLNREDGEQGNTLAGTPRYMPPDLSRGEAYDERSEVYELGCSLFEALTGDTPFTGAAPLELIRQHAEDVPPRLAERRTDVVFPEALEEIVARCLAKEKRDRFQSMKEVQAALTDLRPSAPVIVEETPRAGTAIRTGGYVLITALLVSGVVAVANLGFGIFKSSEKLTEQKALVTKDHTPYGPVLVDAASETLKPRFEERDKHGERWIHAKGNVTNDSLIEISRRFDIERLSLIGDSVDGRGLVFLLELPLKALDMESTQISDKDMRVLTQFEKLEVLRLGNTKVTDKGLAKLQALPRLKSLGIGGLRVTDKTLETVATLKQLDEVFIRNSKFVTADGIKNLSRMPNLTTLTLKEMKIDLPMMQALRGFSKLSTVSMYNTQLDREVLAPLKSLKLNRLKLHKDRLRDDALDLLGEMKTLKNIELGGSSGFTQEGLERLAKKLPQCLIDLEN